MEDPAILKQPPPSNLQKPPGYNPNGATTQPPLPPPPAAQKGPRPLPPVIHQKHRRRCSCCRCCCCCVLFLFVFLLVLALAIVAFSATIYFLYRPTLPDFHFQSMRTKQLKVVVGPEGATVTSDIVARVQATNSNEKVELDYGPTVLRVTAKAGSGDKVVGIGDSSVPGFAQEPGNVTVLAFEAKVIGLAIDDEVGQMLKAGLANGKAMLGVEVKTSVAIKVGKARSGRVQILVSCGPASKKQLDGGETPKCKIKAFGWILLP